MNRKESLVGIGLIAALMALTDWLLFRDQPVARLLRTLGQLRPGWLLLGLALMLAFVGCKATCPHLVLGRLGHRAPLRRCLGYSFVGFYVSSVTPPATGGQPAQIYYVSRDGMPAACGTLNMVLVVVCYQVVVIGYALVVVLLRFDLVANLGGELGLLLLLNAVVSGALTAGILCLMFLPNTVRRLIGGVLGLLVRVRLVRRPEEAREELEKQVEEYRRGANCVRRNPTLMPALLGFAFCQLITLFSVPLVVYYASGLTGSGALDIIGAQALITLAVTSLPLLRTVGAPRDGFVAAMKLPFSTGLVTPAMPVSQDISFYSFLLLSGCVTLLVHLRTRNRRPVAVSPRLPKTAQGTVVT